MELIILEGVDGSGKTTLVHQLADHLGYRVHAFGPPAQPPLREYLHWLLEEPDERVIVDRFHLGEHVYGPIYRGRSLLDTQTRLAIELAAQIRGASLLYLEAPLGLIEARLELRGDDFIQVEHLPFLLGAYNQIVPQSVLPTSIIDTSKDFSIDGIITKCVFQRVQAETYRKAFPMIPGIGSLTPEVILVGEKPNRNRHSDARGIPFAVGPAGQWLYEAVNSQSWAKSCYVTNAVKGDGDTKLVAQEIRFLKTKPTIALGRVAGKILTEHKIPHAEIYHPQYARRFQHHSSDYAQLLAEGFESAVLARETGETVRVGVPRAHSGPPN